MNYIEVESYRRRSETDLELLRRMVAMAQAETEWWQPSGGVFMAAGPHILLGPRRYKINDEVVCSGGAEKFLSEGTACIEQEDPTKRTLVFTNAYANAVESVRFLGGAAPIHFENNNVDSTNLVVRDVDVQNVDGCAIGGSRVGGAAGFLSASLTVENSRFVNCRKVLDSPFDYATLRDCWVQWTSASYMPTNSAAFVVRENSRLNLDRMFGVPCAGGLTTPRVLGARWVDLYGSGGVSATSSRFGGEDAGMPIVYHYAPLPIAYPWMGPKIILEGSQLSCGMAGVEDSAVVYLMASVPQYMAVRDCYGAVDAPFIKKHPDFNLDAWLDAKNINNRIRLDLSRAGMHWNDANPIPPELLPFVC